MIYLLCMLAGCRLLRGRYRLLAVVGSILCLLLLAMVGWKSLYALVMLAGLWLFLPGASWRRKRVGLQSGPVASADRDVNRGDRPYGPDGRAAHLCAGIPFEVSPPPVPALKPPPGIRLKRRCGISFIVRCFCTGGSNSRPRKSVRTPGATAADQR